MITVSSSALDQKSENIKAIQLLMVDANRAKLELKGEYNYREILTSIDADGTVKESHLDYVHPSPLVEDRTWMHG